MRGRNYSLRSIREKHAAIPGSGFARSTTRFPGVLSANRKLFSWFWNFPNGELAQSGDLNQLVQQEVFIAGFLHVLNDWNEPLPLFLPTQTTFAQDDQSRMNRRVEKFDEVPRVRRYDREVMVECNCQTTSSVRPARPTCGTDWEYTSRPANSRTSAGEMFSSSRRRIMRSVRVEAPTSFVVVQASR
jgi:hypothetical protein